jgi:hypothetical protein
MRGLMERPLEEAFDLLRLTQAPTGGYAGRNETGRVAAVVEAPYEQLANARVRTFVPILLERVAREALDRPAASDAKRVSRDGDRGASS